MLDQKHFDKNLMRQPFYYHCLQGVAKCNFSARAEPELALTKGQLVTLHYRYGSDQGSTFHPLLYFNYGFDQRGNRSPGTTGMALTKGHLVTLHYRYGPHQASTGHPPLQVWLSPRVKCHPPLQVWLSLRVNCSPSTTGMALTEGQLFSLHSRYGSH